MEIIMLNSELLVSFDWNEEVKIKVKCVANKSFSIHKVTLLKFNSKHLSLSDLDRLGELVTERVRGRDIRLITDVIIAELELRRSNFNRYGKF